MIPSSIATDRAVFLLSPVTITTVIPAFWHCFIAYLHYSLMMSLIPINKSNVKFYF
jgi:hypothetical protein